MKSNYTIEYASFGMRLGALLIDMAIAIGLLFFITPKIFSLIGEMDLNIDKDLSAGLLLGGLIFYLLGIPLIGILCRSFFECSKLQGTPGKLILGIKVVDFNFKRISFKSSFIRNIVKNFSGLFLYIGYLVALGDRKCMTWHDNAGKTYVIRKIKHDNLINL